jgi:hypothetical protein
MSRTQEFEAILCMQHIIMCMSDSRQGFGLDVGFTDHFKVTTRDCT